HKSKTNQTPLQCEAFLRSLENRNFTAARMELERLFHETGLSGIHPSKPLWGLADEMRSHHLRSTIGMALELIGHRTRRFSTIGAMLHLDSLLARERQTGKLILTEKERLRAKRLLMVYTLRHPKDDFGTVFALNTIFENFPVKSLYSRTLRTYYYSKIFGQNVREGLAGNPHFLMKKRPF
ncbi:MAG: hypothetical protein ACP5G4_09925, partial [bacterium]